MSEKTQKFNKPILNGMKDGIPIGLGYFAVAFAIGINAKRIGLDAIQGFVLSFLNVASAGEVAGLNSIEAKTSLITLALVIFITNARYLLMSAALSQKISPKTPFFHRFLIAYGVTDELFGIGVAYNGYLKPSYMYGAYMVAIPLWAIGTSCGIVMGNILPEIVVNALSVAIFGMFLAVVIPPCRKNKIITGIVVASFALSYLSKLIPFFSSSSRESIRVIILTLIISGIASVLFPINDEEKEDKTDE